MKQTKKSVLTVLQVRNLLSKQNTLLTIGCSFNFQVDNNLQRPKLSLLYWLLGHKTPYSGHNMPCLFYWPQGTLIDWPQTALFILLTTKRPVR